MEIPDKNSLKQNFTKEFYKYTPLMLAAFAEVSDLNIVKFLLQKGADYKVKDDYGNSLLHIAAIYGKNSILEYFIKNLKIEMFSRNLKGETALSIC